MFAISTSSVTWNGPVCPTCHRGYLGSHKCNVEDLQAKIAALQAEIDRLERPSTGEYDYDYTIRP